MVNPMESRSREDHRCCTCCGPSSSRRGFLAGLCALGASIRKLWLDYEDARKQPHFPGQVAWTRSKLIEDMDRIGVRAGILSLASTPGVWFDVGPDEIGAGTSEIRRMSIGRELFAETA